jgi:hypothetical protein
MFVGGARFCQGDLAPMLLAVLGVVSKAEVTTALANNCSLLLLRPSGALLRHRW